MNGANIQRLTLVILLIGLVESAPRIQTDVGVLEGSDKTAYGSDKPYHVYYAIPFAAAPVGDRRFRDPEPFTAADSSQVITSNTYPSACMQAQTFGNSMSEDCLYLNVFVPAVDGDSFDEGANKKVLVFIHGGAFQSGDTSLYPMSREATEYDLVVVTIQYRLGPLGFLSSGTKDLKGNYGLLDQIFALQWVKDNIKRFGGDPNDVTLSGESAGATSCSLIALSRLSKGLFNKVILMSGSALAPWAIDLTYRETFDKMALRAKCIPDPCEKDCDSLTVECLRQKGADELVGLIAKDARVSEEDILALDGYMSYAPVVDGEVLTGDPFDLMMNKSHLIEIGALKRKYLIGMDNNEAMLFVLGSIQSNVVSVQKLMNISDPINKEIVVNNLLAVYPYIPNNEMIKMVMSMYYGNGQVSLQTIVNLMSDIDFVVPAVQLARHYVQACNHLKVYLYVFDAYPEVIVPNFPLRGTSHAIELAFMFDEDGPLAPLSFYINPLDPANADIFPVFRGIWGNFAKTGNPSIPGVIDVPKYDLTGEQYTAISATPEVRSHLFESRVSLWTDDLPGVLGMTGFARGRGNSAMEDLDQGEGAVGSVS